MRIQKHTILILIILLLNSCNNYRQKTFLDFEFGMSYSEYKQHAIKLQNQNLIDNLNDNFFDYYLALDDYKIDVDGITIPKMVKFSTVAHVNRNSRLFSIVLHTDELLNDNELKSIYNIFEAKHGKPRVEWYKNEGIKCWVAIWKIGDVELYMMFNYESGEGSYISFTPRGSLLKNIDAKDKKENGVIDIENKY